MKRYFTILLKQQISSLNNDEFSFYNIDWFVSNHFHTDHIKFSKKKKQT